MIFSEKEQEAFNQIVALTSLDRNKVRDVLFAILTCASLNAHKDVNEITIPYLCTFRLNYKEIPNAKGVEVDIGIEGEPSAMLLKEYVDLKNNEETFTKKYFKRQNRLHFKNLMQMDFDD
jgi:hypothetical protein